MKIHLVNTITNEYIAEEIPEETVPAIFSQFIEMPNVPLAYTTAVLPDGSQYIVWNDACETYVHKDAILAHEWAHVKLKHMDGIQEGLVIDLQKEMEADAMAAEECGMKEIHDMLQDLADRIKREAATYLEPDQDINMIWANDPQVQDFEKRIAKMSL